MSFNNPMIPSAEQFALFRKTFGVNLNSCADELFFLTTRTWMFDTLIFEELLASKGYDSNSDMSMKQFVLDKYGEEIVKLIEDLLNFRSKLRK